MFEKFKNTPLTSTEVILVFPDPQMYQQIPLTAALKIYLFEKNTEKYLEPCLTSTISAKNAPSDIWQGSKNVFQGKQRLLF